MMSQILGIDMTVETLRKNMDFWQERVNLTAEFRWCVRLSYHEAVANHFSLAINEEGSQFNEPQLNAFFTYLSQRSAADRRK